MLLSAIEPISGSNLTIAVYNATTIDNPAFGVKAGQRVQILLLRINSNIPTTLIGPALTKTYQEPMASLAHEIASSDVLA